MDISNLFKARRARFPATWDDSAIPYEWETPQIPELTHVLVGEPDSTSPGHALMAIPVELTTVVLAGLVSIAIDLCGTQKFRHVPIAVIRAP
jgi:hypothetical protein